MDMNNVNIEEIVKQVHAGMAGTAPAASAPAARAWAQKWRLRPHRWPLPKIPA